MKTTSEVLADGNSHQNWVPLLEVAAQEVFELMLSCKIAIAETPVDFQPDITAMVGLAGQLCGVLTIRCSAKSAGLMASKMLGVEVDKASPELCDAFGEVCNMVAGNFKNKVSGLGDGCMLSVPTVITGTDYNLRSLTDSAAVEVRFLFESMPLIITLEVHS
ncbi:MAG: chemotaxis protein CheX [Candidatus Sulfotelmatobacter sp.]|jgi:chemotaxis protein CheX